MTKKKRIGANEERIGPLSDERRKDILEITLRGGAQYIEVHTKRGGGLLHLFGLHRGIRIVWVHEQTY